MVGTRCELIKVIIAEIAKRDIRHVTVKRKKEKIPQLFNRFFTATSIENLESLLIIQKGLTIMSRNEKFRAF